MSDDGEPTVEVQTAEVRVLQVGRRQVTLSMVRQLDWANPADVEPFGRVRTGDKLPGRPEVIDSMWTSQVKSAAPVEIIGSAAGVAELNRYKVQGQPSRQLTPEYQRALDRFAAHHVHDWPRYDPDQQTYDMWKALSLIVLGGLR